jgi:radical SAM superfamily enzyme YgiQ (UPF0313 family)
MTQVLLVSTYELGRQPFALGSARAQLERAGHTVAVADVSLDELDADSVTRAELVAISVPMHTALRLGLEVAAAVRKASPSVHICLFGLYAWLHGRGLLDQVADSVIGGEFEPALVELASRLARDPSLDGVPGLTTRGAPTLAAPALERIEFIPPDRTGLPPLERYARLIGPERGETRLVGSLEASRGCKHRCRHCPVVPVYDGRFFIVPAEVVLADAARQVSAGARHFSFGDPDFLNGPKHALSVARRLHKEHPDVSFDITTKIEHVLRQKELFVELRELGCLFVVSALESLSDRVLEELDKGHTRSDVFEALAVLRGAELALRPSFVPFTPWSTLEDYLELVDFVFGENLVESVDPIQLTIRLLLPPGSSLLNPPLPRGRRAVRIDSELPAYVEGYEPQELGYRWSHADPRMDRLQLDVSRVVEQSRESNYETLLAIRSVAYRVAGRREPSLPQFARFPAAPFVPRIDEPWFCCAEPSGALLRRVTATGAKGCAPCSDA